VVSDSSEHDFYQEDDDDDGDGEDYFYGEDYDEDPYYHGYVEGVEGQW
jgi:hypothetical protein